MPWFPNTLGSRYPWSPIPSVPYALVPNCCPERHRSTEFGGEQGLTDGGRPSQNQVMATDMRDVCFAAQPHRDAQLVFDQLECFGHSGFAQSAQAVDI